MLEHNDNLQYDFFSYLLYFYYVHLITYNIDWTFPQA